MRNAFIRLTEAKCNAGKFHRVKAAENSVL